MDSDLDGLTRDQPVAEVKSLRARDCGDRT